MYVDTILSKQKTVSLPVGAIVKVASIVLSFLALTAFAYFFLLLKPHWVEVFRPAALEMLSGHSPYNIQDGAAGFYNPPWALIPLIPLALLPVKIGSALMSAINIFAFGYVAHRLGAKPLTLALIVTSPFVLYLSSQVNVDFLVALGLVMPPWIGLFFVLTKPQVGGLIALYWIIDGIRTKGYYETAKMALPVASAFALSLILYGPWPLKTGNLLDGDLSWNWSLWPTAIPVGIALLAASIRMRRAGLSLAAAPFLSPYTAIYSWSVAVLGLLPSQAETIAVVIGMWIVRLIIGWPINLSDFTF